jgi:hypothetical protein
MWGIQSCRALLLRHTFQFPGIVAPSSIADHHTAEIGRDQFPHFLITMPGSNLIDRQCRIGFDHGHTGATETRDAVLRSGGAPVSAVRR